MALQTLPPLLMSPAETAPPLAEAVATSPLPALATSVAPSSPHLRSRSVAGTRCPETSNRSGVRLDLQQTTASSVPVDESEVRVMGRGVTGWRGRGESFFLPPC